MNAHPDGPGSVSEWAADRWFRGDPAIKGVATALEMLLDLTYSMNVRGAAEAAGGFVYPRGELGPALERVYVSNPSELGLAADVFAGTDIVNNAYGRVADILGQEGKKMRWIIGAGAVVLSLVTLRYRGRDLSSGMRWIGLSFFGIIAVICFFGQIAWVVELALALSSALALGMLFFSVFQGAVGSGGVTLNRGRSPFIFWLGSAGMAAVLIVYIVHASHEILHRFR